MTNILLLEIANLLSIHYVKPGGDTECSKNDFGNIDYSAISKERFKSLQYIAGYVIFKLYERFKYTRNNINPYTKRCPILFSYFFLLFFLVTPHLALAVQLDIK